MVAQYGSYDGLPCRWLGWEAWIYSNDQWREINAADAANGAALLSAEAYHRAFGELPSLPKAAFQSSE